MKVTVIYINWKNGNSWHTRWQQCGTDAVSWMLTGEEEMLMRARLNDANFNGNGWFLIYKMIAVWRGEPEKIQSEAADLFCFKP